MKLLQLLKESLIQEAEKRIDPCDNLSEGKTFCKNLQKILSSGTGGKGSDKLRKTAIKVFQELRSGDYISMGDKIVLEPGNRMFEDRIQDMKVMSKLLKDNKSCKAISSAIDEDIIKLATKGLTMRVDDQQTYSLFNRINTHSSNQAYIITKLAQEINKSKDFKFYRMDTFDNQQIIEEVQDLLQSSDTYQLLDNLIGRLMQNPETQKTIMDAFNFSRNKGYQIEDEGWNALKDLGYNVYPFSDDFGFIDYFGIDLLAVDSEGAHPVQVSSQMKSNPKIFQYLAPDCKVFGLYKSGDKFIKYQPLQ